MIRVPSKSPKREAVLKIGLDKPTPTIILAAKKAGFSVSAAYIRLLRMGRTSGRIRKGEPPPPNRVVRPAPKAKAKAKGKVAAKTQKAKEPAAHTEKRAHTKSDFVREFPSSVPVADVLAKAKAAGLSVSKQLVYQLRAKETGASGKHAPEKASANAAPRAPSKATTAGRVARGARTAEESEFLRAALGLGLARAHELLRGLEETVTSYVG
jgi:hypothetical protein